MNDERVLVLAPAGRDAELIAAVLAKGGLVCKACRSSSELHEEILRGAGAVLLTEEALSVGTKSMLGEVLEGQPSWSDLPLMYFTNDTEQASAVLWPLNAQRNVTVLERPLRPRTLVSVMQTALRARYRQYEVRDLLAQRETLNRHLESRQKELEYLNQELNAFSYSVSHDLRAPLRAIQGFSRILLEDLGEDASERTARHLERITAATTRMSTLIEDLLELSRLSRTELHRREIDLSALVRRLSNGLSQEQPERQVVFKIADGLRARADEGLLRVVMDNLLGNAWKFTAREEIACIEVGVCSDEGRTAFFVRDNGDGFDMRFAEKLFTAFQRLHVDEEFMGSGIGLATVQRIIHRHGGRVWARGEVGSGATFYFTLP